MGGQFLFAYLLPPESHDLREFLDYWMQLQRANGLHDRLVHKWIDGKPEPLTVPRWSVLRNVAGLGRLRDCIRTNLLIIIYLFPEIVSCHPRPATPYT